MPLLIQGRHTDCITNEAVNHLCLCHTDALISALDESEQLLQQLNLTVGSTQGSKVSSFAKAMQTLENVVGNEDKELKRYVQVFKAPIYTYAEP